MTCKTFEELPVWKQAAELFDQTDNFLERTPQVLGRLSRINSNVPCSRFPTISQKDLNEELPKSSFSSFTLHVVSAGEVRLMLSLAQRRPWAKAFCRELSNIKSIAESCSRQLRGWADSLQNSEIKGPRFLDKATRERYAQKQRAIACQKRLLESLPPDHPLRRKESQS
jgi:hypothetical protein